MVLVGAVALVLGFGALAPAASAAPLRFTDLGTVGASPQAGGRWIAWAEAGGSQGAVSRVDVLSGVRTRIGPPGCRYIDIAADGDLLFTCVPNDARVLDAATGAWTTLPPLRAPVELYESVGYNQLGRHWVELLGRGEKGEAAIYVSRSTGQVRAARPDARHQVDLDDAALSRRLCRGFQRPRVGLDYGGTGYGDLMIAGRWAATTVYQDPDAGIDAPTRVLLGTLRPRCPHAHGRPARHDVFAPGHRPTLRRLDQRDARPRARSRRVA